MRQPLGGTQQACAELLGSLMREGHRDCTIEPELSLGFPTEPEGRAEPAFLLLWGTVMEKQDGDGE